MKLISFTMMLYNGERWVLKVRNELAPQKKSHRQPKIRQQTKEPSLKGTFLSVLMLGAFIFFSWIGIYYLFLIR